METKFKKFLILILFIIISFFFKKKSINIEKSKLENIEKFIKNEYFKKNKNKEKEVIIENNVLKLSISTIGGNIKNLFLKRYKNYHNNDENLYLIKDNSSLFGLEFTNKYCKKLNTYEVEFIPKIKEDEFKYTINMHAKLDNNVSIYYVYVIYKKNNYNIDFSIRTKGFSDFLSTNLEWNQKLLRLEKDQKIENNYNKIFYSINKLKKKINFLNQKKNLHKKAKNIYWIANKQQFFVSILLFKTPLKIYKSKKIIFFLKNENVHSINKISNLKIKIINKNNKEFNLSNKWYFCPLDYNLLKKNKYGFENLIQFGGGVVKYINRYVFLYLFSILEKTNFNYGLIIILMTIIVKLIILPITYNQYKLNSIIEIFRTSFDDINQNKFKNLKLDKKIVINSILYAIIQIPIFYSLFNLFPTLINLRGKSFLWIDNLTYYDSIFNLKFNIPIYGNHISLLTILYSISLLILRKINNSKYKTNNNSIYIMSIIILLFINNYSSGLYLYYFISNIINIIIYFYYKKNL
ncbi:inner membrane protein YidC [Candidatus Karelsulcia muelleri CARI]|uniref:Membrane protein insertase YidC n=1 Tax=Karelsulcia muelleri (strain CARI) TaxID=706194 RepID=E0TJ61_KARMC|nr:inner membrane protein YidC [Candidatus Karelsulcia muelleri CARI]